MSRNHHDHDHDHDHDHKHDGAEHSHSHGHSHDHGHTHDHEHTHDHGHTHPGNDGELSFDKKLEILLGHWIDHNKSHQETYDSWADKAAGENQPETAALLKEISQESQRISLKLEKALHAIRH